ncbi:hypothetical protein RFI_29200, partial [Reticulomyxa filosa]
PKKAFNAPLKTKIIKIHLQNMIVVPEMIASQVDVYNGKGYIHVEIKPVMIGYYLAEFSITYKPVGQGRPGLSSTGSAKFILLIKQNKKSPYFWFFLIGII